ncbi:hypothetical protein BEN47_11710 [Hymenobacter lapidarius]|uniref:protein adenylyltransferase n=1 Tax=Hymenobacter lapidarius TaxID=1908237 RepID=A0A1G1T8E0_9BACT|nr:Fic family protein [Hymenobacter lapidarius]OGX87140.1 hypothetical protein BEN47_11710 [Hymenobacter lapidarius]
MAVLNDRFSDENGVRLNKLGITDKDQLAQAETESSLPRLTQLNREGGIQGGQYDQAHLKQVHERLFSGVYQWAGETRADREFQGHKDTNVTGFKETMTYAPHKEVPERLDAIGAQLNKENNLKGLAPDKFAERAAYYLDQYNHTHAFRDGNGRTMQATFTQLGKAAGYDVNFNRASPEILNRSRDLAIVRQYPPAEAGKNLQPLKDMFKQVITQTPGAEAEKLRDPSQAPARTPELSQVMRAMDARRELEVTGYRSANIIANMPGAGNREQGVQLAQRVEAVNLDPKVLNGPGINEMQLAADKIIKHPGLKDTPLDIADGKRLKVASMQVMQLAEGKEIVAPQQQKQPAALVQEKSAHPAAQVVKTHEEAQLVFAKAAREVAKELEANERHAERSRSMTFLVDTGDLHNYLSTGYC